MNDAVRIRYERDEGEYLRGAEFEMPSPEDAERLHPKAKILRYTDGREYHKPRAEKQESVSDDKAPARKAAKSDKGDKE